jgi:hypothetical protein
MKSFVLNSVSNAIPEEWKLRSCCQEPQMYLAIEEANKQQTYKNNKYV